MALRGAGKYREYVTIKRPVETELPDGSVPTEYVDLLTTYCCLKMRDGSVEVIASQDNITQLITFEMRYRTDYVFVEGDRLIWRERNLKIHGFSWDILRTTLWIKCITHNETTSDGNPGS